MFFEVYSTLWKRFIALDIITAVSVAQTFSGMFGRSPVGMHVSDTGDVFDSLWSVKIVAARVLW